MIRLLIKNGEEVRELEFADDCISIGRTADNSIVVPDKKTSRKHAKIEKIGSEYRLSDLESNNGTKVNGKEIVLHTLVQGDEVKIGDSLITVVRVDGPGAAQAAPPPLEEVVEKAPVPIEKKLEIKKKIDTFKESSEEIRARAAAPTRLKILRKLASIAAALGILVAAVFGLMHLAKKEVGETGQARTKNESKAEPTPEAAKAELEKLQQEAAAAPVVTQDLIDRAKEGSNKYEKFYPAQAGDGNANPFKDLVTALEKRRDDDFVQRQNDLMGAVELALMNKKYADALALIKKFHNDCRDTAFAVTAAQQLTRVNETVQADFEFVMKTGRGYELQRMYEKAKSYYQENAGFFVGTEYQSQIAKKPDDMDLLARADAERSEPRNNGSDLVQKEKPKEEPAKVDSGKKDDPLVVEPKKEPAKSDPAKKSEPPARKKVDVSTLMARVVEAVNAGKYTSEYKLNDGTKGIPAKADSSTLTLKDETKVSWSDVAPAGLFNLMVNSGMKDEDFLAIADWAHSAGLDNESKKILNRYVAGNKEKKAKADMLVLSWGDLTAVENLCKTLASTNDKNQMDKVFGEILAYFNNTGLSSEIRESIKAKALEALRASKKKHLDAISSKAKNAAGFGAVAQAKQRLNELRAEALKIIYDTKIYLPESHPDWPKGDKINGQAKVDEAVKAVRELWNNAGQYVASLDGSVARDIESVQHINEKYLAELGEKPSEDDLKAYEVVMNNLNDKIDLKSFALNSKEAEIYSWNRRVEEYNEKCNEPGVTAEEKAHAKVLNDYREMMGRKRLFLVAPLCRATKKHSANCNAANRIWHVGSDGDPQSRAKAEGFGAGVGENVAIGYGHPRDIWERGWYRASDHHRNGLSDSWNCMGYGYVGSVGTENFSNTSTPKGFPGK